MQSDKAARIRQLRQTVEPEFIGTADWPKTGWRWERNFKIFDGALIATIEMYQRRFGKGRVTIGTYFDKNVCKPVPTDMFVGIYIQDVDEQAEAFNKALEQWLDPPKS